ncbi:MAG: XdhC family protein [Pseudolabrys sp.]
MNPIAAELKTTAAASPDLLDTMVALRNQRKSYAHATVIETRGSASARTGSKAILSEDGRILAGWVGGGCAAAACASMSSRFSRGRGFGFWGTGK